MNKTRKDFMKSELMIRAAVGLLVYFMILFSCGKSGSNRKDPPFWITMANNTGNTTSIVHPNANNPALGNRPSGSGGANPAAAPVEGMYFFHPDHLGSVSMVTDAHGKMVTGMDIDSGMSYITYKPYGEINRTNSSGPDIYRYKYTAQEDDPELGLYYYKARWYDPAIARFTQADSIIDANSVQGMNQYMYTEGNPVNFRDPSGLSKSSGGMAGIIHAFNTNFKNTQNDWNHWAKNAQNDYHPWAKNLQNDFHPWMKNAQTDYHKAMARNIHTANEHIYRYLYGKGRNNNDLDKNLTHGNDFDGFFEWAYDPLQFPARAYMRSDFGQGYKRFFGYIAHSTRHPWGAFIKSDIGRSDVGLFIQRNEHCLALAVHIALLYSGLNSIGAVGDSTVVGSALVNGAGIPNWFVNGFYYYTGYTYWSPVSSGASVVQASQKCHMQSL